jgi:tryptophan halogenase
MNIVVIGGGAAGWLTALYAKKIHSEHNIILVESEEYGILGAGEGSTPHLLQLLSFLEIPYADLIKNCKATIKNGIKFTNWSNDGKSFFHPFPSFGPASNDLNYRIKNVFSENETQFSHYCASLKNNSMGEYSLMEKISYQNSVPFINNKEQKIITQFGLVAIHFNAKLLADYLRSVGEERGIVRKEGIVKTIFNDKDGYINKIKTDKEEISCDFVFDCSGFKKLVIGNHYKSNWKPHSDYLPAKKAIPFFLKLDKEIPPYTEAIAMDYGWMWKIPTQDRYGCGYVFDSDFISDEEAIKEIENYLGFEPEYPRKEKGAFDFSAGCFEDIWIKNCLSLGLSAGFLEPLEATSITQTIFALKRFMSDKQNLYTKNNFIKKQFNSIYLKETQEIVEFLYLHYVTNKKNTKFWQDFTKNNTMPEHIFYILNVCKEKVLNNIHDFNKNTPFDIFSFYHVLIGNKIIDKKDMQRNSKFLLDDDKKEDYENILNEQKIIMPQFLTHNEFIDMIKNEA